MVFILRAMCPPMKAGRMVLRDTSEYWGGVPHYRTCDVLSKGYRLNPTVDIGMDKYFFSSTNIEWVCTVFL